MRKYILLLGYVLLISCSKSAKFQLLTSKQTGIDFKNTIIATDSLNVMKYEYIYNGGGVGIADLNNDGLQDIIFAGNQVSPQIYINEGNFKFKDITLNFAGLSNDQWYSSVTVVDINGDGWQDVYLTSTSSNDPQKRKNRLWVSNGANNGIEPTFTEMAEKYGIADTSFSVNAAFFDYDRDGYLDLYILNNTLNERMNTSYRERVNDGTAPNNDRLYHNNGNDTFTDVTKQAGIVFEGFGLGLAVSDVNKDGYPDIYVSNDYNSNDLLYINMGDGTFRNEIKKYLSYQSKSSMGNDIADVNNDGNPDIFSLDMMPEKYYKKKQTINGFSYMFYILEDKFGYEHQILRNMLHLHNGFINGEMVPFSEVGQMMGIYQTDWSWSPLFADYDNDGDKDLLITTGYPRDLTDKDWTKMKVKAVGNYASDDLLMEMAPAIKIPNVAFENTGNLSFIKRTNWLPQNPTYSYGASFADLDNDGDLDYVVNNLNDEAFILRNTTKEKSKKQSNWIKVKLVGKGANSMAIGAKVELWDKGKYQFTEHFLTRGYASSVDPVVHFGLSQDLLIDSVKVTWPASGNTSVLKNISANQTIEINELTSVPAGKEIQTPSISELLFTKVENAVNYVHEQNEYIDFFVDQTIIAHKFSQIGPRMVKGDLNNDGNEDIIIGSTNKLPTTVLLRKGNRFEEAGFDGLTAQKGFSEADFAIVDIDRDGDNDVVAIAGGYENKQESEYQHWLYENRGGTFIKTALPIPQFPASVVRPCDFDHDGDIDLFVGARVKKGMFPYANHSWLIQNNLGKLSVDSTSKLNLGMVTDAVWTDWDKDGLEDLLVAREWNSVVILKNMNGKELVPRILPELESQQGLWYSLAAGDFDQDGDDDFIVGNLGYNNRFTVNDKYPLTLYAIDLDMDGIIDPLSTAYWKDQEGKMKEYPINYLDELWSQSAFFHVKFKDYAQFSFTGIDETLDENTMQRLEFKLQVNTTASYILWNDNSKFNWEKLPVSLQVSPVRKMIVQDFNGDNYPDVLIGGNDHTFDIATGYYDANKGLVLMNKGKKKDKGMPSFEVLTPSQSGILLQGMVESLLYFKGDTSLVVAGFNRAKANVFEHINVKK